MNREDISRIAEDVVAHLMPMEEETGDGEGVDERDDEFMREASRLLWDAVRNPEMKGVRAFVVKRDEDGKVVLEAER